MQYVKLILYYILDLIFLCMDAVDIKRGDIFDRDIFNTFRLKNTNRRFADSRVYKKNGILYLVRLLEGDRFEVVFVVE